jgi:ADP-ribosylglycohydrolase
MHDVLDPATMLADELTQRRESGYDVSAVTEQIDEALRSGEVDAIARAHRALEETELRPGWWYEEPTAFDEIQRVLPETPDISPFRLTEDEFRDRLLGAWLGRCAGCNLGKPVEMWTRDRIRAYLEPGNEYPITDYIPLLDWADERMTTWFRGSMRGHVTCMARDDDIDYTILGLHVLETYGRSFGPMDVAREWLNLLPFTQVYTAERAAYRNVVAGYTAPETAVHHNPYREWIGAQIRADVWGYVNPGEPAAAARLAHQDASLSHTRNGIYGELWAAALIAAAFVTDDVRTAIDIANHYIPPMSRILEAIADTIRDFDEGVDWETCRDRIEDRYYGGYSPVHTVNNTALITAALLWGAGDYTKTIGLAVQGGWDTDCTAATAGSVFGAMYGATALPEHWTEPLNDLVRSAISGFDNSRISDLAERTFRQAMQRDRPKRRGR